MRKSSVFVVFTLALSLGACSPKATEGGNEQAENADDPGDTGTESGGSEDNQTTNTGDGDGDPGMTTNFVPDNDILDIAECDPFAQDCPEGEKCVAYASTGGTWDANRCVTVNGDGKSGDQCIYDGAAVGSDDCDEDHVCWNALDQDGQLIGTCFPFCTGGADNPICEDSDQSCRIVNDGTIAVCLPNCDPLLQECDEGLGCYWSGGSQTFQCIITAGGIETGLPCGFNNDCNPGHFCAAAEVLEACDGSACCATFCDTLEEPSTCTGMHECVPFFEEGTAPPVYEDLGLCILPV